MVDTEISGKLSAVCKAFVPLAVSAEVLEDTKENSSNWAPPKLPPTSTPGPSFSEP